MRPETKASIEAQITDIKCTWEIGRHNPFPGEKMRNVVAQYQRARQMALEGGYDALLTVEDDMVIPTDAVEKLYATDAPVVYGVYMLRHGVPTLSAWRYENNRSLGMSLSLYPQEIKAARARGWVEVCGVGWGCTLIRRNVLERLTVHGNDEHDAGDLAFGMDCVRAGIKQIARFDVPCGHYDHNGALLEISMNGGVVSRVYALQPVVANVMGNSMPMRGGRYYSIPVEVALELQRAGYVRIVNEDDSQEEAGEREQPDITGREMAIDPKAATRGTRGKKAK